MPEIQAFRGLRYNLAKVGSLSDIIAPPYDVIDSALQDQLYKRSEYNIIRLELNRPEPTDTTQDEIYHRASRVLRNWIREGVLESEGDPAIYVYHQEFEHVGVRYNRRGFMARVRLQRFGEGTIYPHEQTYPKAKEDRLKLTRATRTNLSQIFGLYPDPNNSIQELLEQHILNVRPLEAVDHLGIIHRMWPVTDPRVIGDIAAAVCHLPMFVADGHHRYETACNYRDELATQGGIAADHPANFVLTMLIGMNDPGLLVLPTHRLFEGVREIGAAEICEKLSPYFDCEIFDHSPAQAAKIWKDMEEIDDQTMMALYSAQDGKWIVISAREEALKKMAELSPGQSAAWCGLGVAILHRLVIQDLLGLYEIPKPTYVHLLEEVIEGIERRLEGEKHYPLAALVMPATLEHIRQVSLHQERMPAKSTYFFPKLLSGLVLNRLE